MDAPTAPANLTTTCIWAGVVISVALAVSMACVAIFNPKDTSTGTLLVGIFLPAITGLFGVALQGIHKLTNSNFQSAKEATAASEAALKASQELVQTLQLQIAQSKL